MNEVIMIIFAGITAIATSFPVVRDFLRERREKKSSALKYEDYLDRMSWLRRNKIVENPTHAIAIARGDRELPHSSIKQIEKMNVNNIPQWVKEKLPGYK